jgi:hypothetical protein
VAPRVPLIVVVAQALLAAIFLFRLGEAPDLAALNGDRLGSHRRCWQGLVRRRHGQQRPRCSPGCRGGVLLPQLELPGQAHGGSEGLRVLDPHVDAERRLETSHEQLDPLPFVEGAGARQERLEPVLILGDRACAPTLRQLGQRGGPEWRPVAQVQKFLEAAQRRSSLVRLDLDEPHLRALLQIVARHPHLLLLHNPLLMKIRLASVGEDQRIGFPVVTRKIQFLEPRRPIMVMLPIVGLGDA